VWGLWQRWFAAGHFSNDKGGRDLQHKVEAKAFAHFAQRVKEVEGQDPCLNMLSTLASGGVFKQRFI